MILTIDIGNTNIVFGGFQDGEPLFISRIKTDTVKTSDEYASLLSSVIGLRGFDIKKMQGGIISSVVPQISSTLKKALLRLGAKKVLVLKPDINTDIKIDIDHPSQLGSDMVASAAGATLKYKLPAVIVDMGTATKISCITEDKTIIGCSIMPGVNISLEALTKRTAQLISVSLDDEEIPLIGKNTVDSLKSGVVLGTASMIDGMLERFKKELKKEPSVILTGGISPIILPHLKSKVYHDSKIVLYGLNAIYAIN